MSSKKKSPRSARVTAIGVLGLVLAGLGIAIVMASQESSSQIAPRPTVDAPLPHMAAEPMPKKAPAARTPAKATVTAAVVPVPVTGPVAVTRSVAVARPEAVTRPVEIAVAPKASTVESASRTTGEPAAVTITGCLERSDTTYRLTETTGADAPKSRNWKKGFLKKGMAPVEVVDAANRLNLPNHVGQRVSVTGLLVDREMTLRSLQRVATSCD
jgi:hypothetical protein